MKILVTGGAGFIGSAVVRKAISQGFEVVNVDVLTYAACLENLDAVAECQGYVFEQVDICDRAALDLVFTKHRPDAVMHLAAESHVDRSIDNPKNFIDSNIVSTYNFIDEFKRFNIKFKNSKFIHISTDEVYGDIQSNLRASEKTPYNPGNPYSATKAASDHLINSYINTYKINAIITNCCNNYGPKQNPEKFIPKIIFNILSNKKLPLYGKGQNTREWIYVLDHCKALYRIYQRGKVGETYNIGSNQNFKNIDLTKKIITLAKEKKYYNKKSKITYIKDRPGHDLRYASNSQKIRKYIKWKPEVMINKGLRNTLEWYKTNKKFFKYIRKKNFISRLGKNR